MAGSIFSLELNMLYHPGDCDRYYLTEEQVNLGIKYIETKY